MSFEISFGSGFATAVERQVGRIMAEKLNDLREIMIEEFSAPKSGRIYRRPSGGFYHASAPGEPPAVRTGRLRGSISEPQVTRSGALVVGQMIVAAPYAGYLERGTGRIAPRPFVRPAIEEILRRRT